MYYLFLARLVGVWVGMGVVVVEDACFAMGEHEEER
jgi:hypothetical protein